MLPKLYVNGFSCLKGDATTEDFAPFVEARKLRRAEQISKNLLLCTYRALQQARLPEQEVHEMGISLGIGAGALESTFKFINSILEDGDELSSPTAFASSVHNSTALMLSMFLKIHGPCVITGQFDASFAGALLTAQQFLAKKMCSHVLVAVTEDVNPLVQEELTKDSSAFNPFVYQPACPALRVAGAYVVSSTPTAQTRFALRDIHLSCSSDKSAKTTPQLDVCSCAHSALLLANALEKKEPVSFREQFAGTILEVKAEPYVFS